MRILIVDDDFTTRTILKEVLSGYGDLDMCHNGIEAVEAFTLSLDAGEHYDLVLMDMLMPQMGGVEALHKLRRLEANKGLVPSQRCKAIVLSSVEEVKSVINAFKLGEIDTYLVKPLDVAQLLTNVKELNCI